MGKSSFPCRFALFKKHALRALCFLERAKAAPSKLWPARRKSSDCCGLYDFGKNRDRVMDRNSHFFIVKHNRVCDHADLTGFFDPDGYGMLRCPMFHRSARIYQPGDQSVKPHRMENSANSSATRFASRSLWWRHPARRGGQNRHSSGIFIFFSFEEGSNFVQKIRQYRTSFSFRRESFLFSCALDQISASMHISVLVPAGGKELFQQMQLIY